MHGRWWLIFAVHSTQNDDFFHILLNIISFIVQFTQNVSVAAALNDLLQAIHKWKTDLNWEVNIARKSPKSALPWCNGWTIPDSRETNELREKHKCTSVEVIKKWYPKHHPYVLWRICTRMHGWCERPMMAIKKGVKVIFTTMSNKPLWRSVEPSIYNRNHVQCGGRNASWLVFVFQRNDTKFMSLVFRYNAKDDLCKKNRFHATFTRTRLTWITFNSTKINKAIILSMIPLIRRALLLVQPNELRANPNRLQFYCANIGTSSQINHWKNNKNKTMHTRLYFRYSIDAIS